MRWQFNTKQDAEVCRLAMRGAGTNVQKLATVLCERPFSHLKELEAVYEAEHGESLRKTVEKETSGNVENVLTAGLRSPADTRALILHQCVAGAGTNQAGLVDCILTITPEEMTVLNETWTTRFGLPIMARVMIDGVLAGPFHYLLEQATCMNKPAGPVDQDKVKADCLILLAAGEGKTGTDEKAFSVLFSTRSREHLIFLDEEYKKVSPKKRSLVEAIRDEFSSQLEIALLACCQKPAEYWADRFNAAMKGLGTREKDLTNAILLSEGNLKDAAASYKHKYGKNLVDVVAKELSGDLEKVLIPYLNYRLK